MIIGFIGFGKVSRNILDLVKSEDITFVTSLENRSAKTIENIRGCDIEVEDTFKSVVSKSDIVISANSPKNALAVAQEYGKYVSGIYLDLNNISPDTTSEIGKHVKNFVDGAIIGKIDSDNPILYISGEMADDLLFLNEFIETKKVSNNIGDVAILKLIRSSYTKTLSALLIESLDIAKSYGLENEFFEVMSLTEGDEFKEKSLSRINNTLNSAKRKAEELEEIVAYFDENELIMVNAALEKLSR